MRRGLLIALVVACGAPRPTTTLARDTARCSAAAEDRDGFEDDDGCPDLDNDGDKIADIDDRCMNEPETINGVDDADGCPDRCRVHVEPAKHCVLGPLFFARGELTSKHNAPLVELTTHAMVQTRDAIDLVTLTGYRDANEPGALSRLRADELERQLVADGVEPDRLEVVDGGVATDVDDNRRRRVDMMIAKQRVSEHDRDDWDCTPMGPLNIRFTDEQRVARCLPPRSP